MNCCHYCSVVAKKQQIISCNYCTNQYCLKCIKFLLSQSPVQKVFPQHSVQQIQQKKVNKKWLCFSCIKVCPCKICKGVGMANVQKILLGKKDKVIVKKTVNDYQQYYPDIGIFKSIEFGTLNPFEKQYFMNKVMLHGRPKNDTIISLKEISLKGIIENQKSQKKQNVIMIDSDQNHEPHQVVQVSDQNETLMRDQSKIHNGNGSKMIQIQQIKVKNQMIIEQGKQNPQNKQKIPQKMSIQSSQHHVDA